MVIDDGQQHHRRDGRFEARLDFAEGNRRNHESFGSVSVEDSGEKEISNCFINEFTTDD